MSEDLAKQAIEGLQSLVDIGLALFDHIGSIEVELVKARDRIEELEAKLRKSALQELSALGQAQDAYQAQVVAEAKLVLAQEHVEVLEADVERLEDEVDRLRDALREAIYLLDPDEDDVLKGAGIYRIVSRYVAAGGALPDHVVTALQEVEGEQ